MSEPEYDVDGNCLHHPQIRLKRRNSAGEWKIVLTKCPLCAVNAATSSSSTRSSFKRERRSTRRNSGNYDDRGHRYSGHSGSLYPKCRDVCSSSMSVCSSDTTVTTATSMTTASFSSGSSSLSRNLEELSISDRSSQNDAQNSQSDLPKSTTRSSRPPSTQRKRVVCGMNFVCPETNRRGSYTGQIHPDTQRPHGLGTLRFRDGSMCEGEWCMGHLSKEQSCPSSSSSATSSCPSGSSSDGAGGRNSHGGLDHRRPSRRERFRHSDSMRSVESLGTVSSQSTHSLRHSFTEEEEVDNATLEASDSETSLDNSLESDGEQSLPSHRSQSNTQKSPYSARENKTLSPMPAMPKSVLMTQSPGNQSYTHSISSAPPRMNHIHKSPGNHHSISPGNSSCITASSPGNSFSISPGNLSVVSGLSSHSGSLLHEDHRSIHRETKQDRRRYSDNNYQTEINNDRRRYSDVNYQMRKSLSKVREDSQIEHC